MVTPVASAPTAYKSCVACCYRIIGGAATPPHHVANMPIAFVGKYVSLRIAMFFVERHAGCLPFRCDVCFSCFVDNVNKTETFYLNLS